GGGGGRLGWLGRGRGPQVPQKERKREPAREARRSGGRLARLGRASGPQVPQKERKREPAREARRSGGRLARLGREGPQVPQKERTPAHFSGLRSADQVARARRARPRGLDPGASLAAWLTSPSSS